MHLPPRGVVRFLGWHVLKLAFWHFAHPKLNLGFVFASVFAVFSSKKTPQPAHCTVQKHAQLSISHRFFRCFPVCRISHRFLQCFCRLSTFCTCRIMPASTCICLSALCGGGGGMGGGGDNVHANAACVFCFLLLFPMCRISHRFLRCFCRLSTFCTCQLRLAFVFQLCAGVRGGMGGGVMTSMRMRLLSSVSFVALLLKRCRLLCEALVAASHCFSFETSTMQKPRVFAAFQTKTSKTTQKKTT